MYYTSGSADDSASDILSVVGDNEEELERAVAVVPQLPLDLTTFASNIPIAIEKEKLAELNLEM